MTSSLSHCANVHNVFILFFYWEIFFRVMTDWIKDKQERWNMLSQNLFAALKSIPKWQLEFQACRAWPKLFLFNYNCILNIVARFIIFFILIHIMPNLIMQIIVRFLSFKTKLLLNYAVKCNGRHWHHISRSGALRWNFAKQRPF